jgi:hypothetical protein
VVGVSGILTPYSQYVVSYSVTELGYDTALYYYAGVTSQRCASTGNSDCSLSVTEGYCESVPGYVDPYNSCVYPLGNAVAEVDIGQTTVQDLLYFNISTHWLATAYYYNNGDESGYWNPYCFTDWGLIPSPSFTFPQGGGSTILDDPTIILGGTVWAVDSTPPSITEVVPSSVLLGSSGQLTIYGSQLAAGGQDMNPTVSLVSGSGLTLNRSSVSDEQLVFSYNISSDASTGADGIQVTNYAGTSNEMNITVGDLTPQITAVNQSIWYAGIPVALVVSGSHFGSNPTITVAGLGVSSTQTSGSDTQVTASLIIDPASPGGSVMITVTSNGKNGTGFVMTPGQSSQATASAYIYPIPAPAPTISFGGIDVTNQSCDPNGTPAQAALCVVVGQNITLTASVNLPAGVAVSSQSWAISSGTAVGGYAASATSCTSANPLYSCGGSVVPLNTTGPNFTFYWVDANAVGTGATRRMTYTYWLNNDPNNSAAAAVTFTVTGPSGVDVQVTQNPGYIDIIPVTFSLDGTLTPNPTGVPALFPGGFTGIGGEVGIQFLVNQTAATFPTNDNGRYSWVQLIKSDTTWQLWSAATPTPSGTPAPGPKTCSQFSSQTSNMAELDNSYPYGNTATVFTTNVPNDTATDTPSWELRQDWGEFSRAFSAQMYLMWDPQLPINCQPGATCTSIPVPLGFVVWGFSADTVNTLDPSQGSDSGTTPTGTSWKLQGCSTSYVSTGPGGKQFQATSVHPMWDGTYLNANNNSSICH